MFVDGWSNGVSGVYLDPDVGVTQGIIKGLHFASNS